MFFQLYIFLFIKSFKQSVAGLAIQTEAVNTRTIGDFYSWELANVWKLIHTNSLVQCPVLIFVIIIIIYFENVHFFHATLGFDVCPYEVPPHIPEYRPFRM